MYFNGDVLDVLLLSERKLLEGLEVTGMKMYGEQLKIFFGDNILMTVDVWNGSQLDYTVEVIGGK